MDPLTQQKALERLAANQRFITRTNDRRYLLSGLIRCAVCGSPFAGHPSKAHGKQRYYYACNDNRPGKRRKAEKGHSPYVRAEWIETLVWEYVRRFFWDPGEVLERLKEHATTDEEADALEQRHADLQKRLRNKHAEKDRYVKLYAQGHIDDSELAAYLQDVNLQADSLRLLLDSIETELSEKSEQKQLAETTAAWLASLRERLAEVEADTEEAYATRRELVRLLVKTITAGRDEEGRIRVEITYRFGPPTEAQSVTGESPGIAGRQSVGVDALPNSVK